MGGAGKHLLSKRIIVYETAAFACVIALIWLDEVLDLPALLLGAPTTPVNWQESLLETAVISLVWGLVIRLTSRLFQRMKYLEGLLPVCAACKRIRCQNGRWQQIESYLMEQSDAQFTHGICPDCAERLYPDFNPYKTKTAV